MTNRQVLLLERLATLVRGPFPALTRRDATLPSVPGKAFAITGPRRAGKTSFMWQQLNDRLREGRPRETLLLLGLEDDRLAGVSTEDLDWLLEEYFARYPRFRHEEHVTLCLDEVQVVPGWERFVRRILDTEKIEMLVSGSSARLLSREVATSLRGRGLEVRIHPFSFREALRHAGEEPDLGWDELGPDGRSTLQHHFRAWLDTGGFPEVQSLAPPDRRIVLSSYVDIMMLRDVIDRHHVSNPLALRWLQRRLLSRPGGGFSVQALFEQAKSEGISVGKDSFHDYVSYLEDCFLIRTVPLHGNHARQRVNLRKVFPVDTGFATLYADAEDRVALLETAVMVELERRGYEVTYLMTEEREEAGLLGTRPGDRVLVSVKAGIDEGFAGLAAAHKAKPLVLTLDVVAPGGGVRGVARQPAARWFLDT